MKVHTINFLKGSAFATFAALLTVSPSYAASIINGDFEANTVSGGIENFNLGSQQGFAYQGTGPTVVTGWTALDGSGNGGLSYLGNTIFNNNGASSRTVQLNGQTSRGGASTLVSGLVTGERVDVTFDLSGNIAPLGSSTETIPVLDVTLSNSTSITTNTNITLGFVPKFSVAGNLSPSLAAPIGGAAANIGFNTFVASFLYTGTNPTATLSFISRSGTNLGPIIDNVRVAPVPFEFSPVSGFIAGGILLGSYKLVNRKKSAA